MPKKIVEIIAAGTVAAITATGCGTEQRDILHEIEQAAPTGIWLAPYAFRYQSPEGVRSAVRPFAEVDGEFDCRPVGEIGAASARLYVIEDGQRLVELEQPETEDGIFRQLDEIGAQTIHCVEFDPNDTYQIIPNEDDQENSYRIPLVGDFPDGEKLVGQGDRNLSPSVLDPMG